MFYILLNGSITTIFIVFLSKLILVSQLKSLKKYTHRLSNSISILMSSHETQCEGGVKTRNIINSFKGLINVNSNIHQLLFKNRIANMICQTIKRNDPFGTFICICLTPVLIAIFMLPIIKFPSSDTESYIRLCRAILIYWISYSILGLKCNELLFFLRTKYLRL